MTSRDRNGGKRDLEAERLRKMREAVRDLPDPERRDVTREDVETLREAGLEELAEIADHYV